MLSDIFAWRLVTAAVSLSLLAASPALAASAINGFSSDRSMSMEEVLVEAPLFHSLADELAAAAKIPGAVTVIDTEKLRQKNLLNLADMLRYVPGVWASSTSGGQGVFFSSRGSNLDATAYDDNGIKLLQDGLPVTTADGNNHNRAIDPLSARSASVARGANAMSYGASTLGGAINFTTPTGYDFQGIGVRLNAGSHELASARLTAAGADNTVDGLISLETHSWGGYRDHSEERRNGLYANAGWQILDRLTTRLYATWLENEQQLAGSLSQQQMAADPQQASAGAIGGNFQLNVDTWRLASRSTWQSRENQRWEFGVFVEEQSLYHPVVDQVLVDFDGAGPMSPVEVFSLLIDTDHREAGAMMRFHQTMGPHELTLGVNYGTNSVDGGHYRNLAGTRNGLSKRIDNSAESWEWFVQDHWRISDRVALILALQVVDADRETSSTSVAGGSVVNPRGSYDAVNPRVGLLWEISDASSLYANLSRLYEPPTNFELQDDMRGADLPLDAMHGTVAEIGTRGSQKLSQDARWLWDVALYYARVRDEILSRDDPAAPGTSLSTNVDETVHAGIEALFAGHIRLGRQGVISVEPTVSLTLNRFRFSSDPLYDNNDLPAAPDYVVRAEMMFHHASGYYLGPVIDWVGRRWADFSNTYPVDEYQLLGLRGGYEAQEWRVFVEVQNLLEEDYVATFSVRDRAAVNAEILNPGSPLSVYTGLEFTF